MARKRFAVKPIEPLVLEFADGTEKEVIFTIEALMLLQSEFGDLKELGEKAENKPFDLAGKLLYCGMKVLNNETTLEEANAIIMGGGLPLMEVLFENILETFDGLESTPEELKKKMEEMVLQILEK